MCLITAKSVLIITLLVHSVLGSPFKFPDQQSQPEHNRYEQQRLGQSEGRFINNPSLQDVEDRRRDRNRKRPCVPYTPFRNNPNGRRMEQGRTFFSLYSNDFNYGAGGSGGSRPQYDTYGGYPCYSLGGQHTQRPERPHYPGTGSLGGGTTNDASGTGNRPGGFGFFGPGGLFDLSQWNRPQSGAFPSGILGGHATGSNSDPNAVKPVFEANVEDTLQDAVSVPQIAGGITNSVSGFPITQATGPQTFATNNRRSFGKASNKANQLPWWTFFGLFN